MNKSKTAVSVSKLVSLVQLICGMLLILFFAICIFYYITDADYRAYVGISFLMLSIVCEIIGIVLIMLSRKRRKLIKYFKTYASYIASNPTCTIADIARAMNSSEVSVRKNIQLMIDKNYFEFTHIDQETNRVVIVNKMQYIQQQGQASELLPVKCKCCGGMNKVARGKTAECEYCGSPIRG